MRIGIAWRDDRSRGRRTVVGQILAAPGKGE
jgi:hypothetical protein